MKRKNTPTAPKIVEYLAKKQVNRWELSKELDKSYANIHSNINKLQEEGYIKVAEIKPSEKNPNMQVEYYRLTFRGLVFALGQITTTEELEKTAKLYKDELLVFREWDSFKAHGATEEIMENVKVYSCLEPPPTVTYGVNMWELAARNRFSAGIPGEEIRQTMNEWLLGVYFPILIEKRKRTIETIKDNQTLRDFVNEKFKNEVERTRAALDRWKDLLNMFS